MNVPTDLSSMISQFDATLAADEKKLDDLNKQIAASEKTLAALTARNAAAGSAGEAPGYGSSYVTPPPMSPAQFEAAKQNMIARIQLQAAQQHQSQMQQLFQGLMQGPAPQGPSSVV